MQFQVANWATAAKCWTMALLQRARELIIHLSQCHVMTREQENVVSVAEQCGEWKKKKTRLILCLKSFIEIQIVSFKYKKKVKFLFFSKFGSRYCHIYSVHLCSLVDYGSLCDCETFINPPGVIENANEWCQRYHCIIGVYFPTAIYSHRGLKAACRV